ncbi:ATP-dependent RNA helicase-like protein dbp9 [Microthyrium microscopicum]|uniref:RNA helicase n=1 Tax=Microthyrium microscopicum TaxID=703497 RepID=A0A6A6URF6_9PEZI|nr:ATP-dependent RNA helicase-like protein dbp9 [Microthyrium microscopicum]
MKRKLNSNNEPEATATSSKKTSPTSFDKLNLAPPLLQAIIAQKFSTPTPVQAQVIPAALAGKNILARSKTGSGKTAAYVLPVLQAILSRKAAASSSSDTKAVSALILVPTRELAVQVSKVVEAFAVYCAQDVRVENLTRKEDDKVQRARLAALPDIVVATPGRVAVHINSSSLKLDNLTHVVVDEADLVLSYGYDEDLQMIAKVMPKSVQAILMSATLRAEVDTLSTLFAQDPVVIELDDEEKEDGKVSQFVVKCAEDEKFLLVYAIFVLKLVKGKTIIFVGDIDRCYRLKLFLEQFAIKSCVLNSELPVNSRIHVVEEFNKNVYDIIIATDENEIIGEENTKSTATKKKSAPKKDDGKSTKELAEGENEEEVVDESQEIANGPPKKKQKSAKGKSKAKTDKDYGVARGIDFKAVACILNFDLPTTSKSYTHRIGRTARAGQAGMALSFVIPANQYRKHKPTSISSTEHDEAVLTKITTAQEKRGASIEPYAFDMAKLEGFRYRLGDALKAVSAGAVREARVRELRQELVKSDKLKRHFEENPNELKHLRHDGELRAAKVRPHLKHVPEYLLPGGAKKALEQEVGFVSAYKKPEDKKKRGKGGRRVGGGGKRKVNPLQSFKAKSGRR